MDIISIIVPIYNVEKYLAKCLESILGQTYTALEIILVNDGSKDRSLEICRSYEERDERIIVIDKVNEGVARARNIGLEHATGKYIAFVDPDDWLEENMYEELHKTLAESSYPICLCNYFKDSKKKSSAKCFEFTESFLAEDEVTEQVITHMIGIEDLMPKYTYIMGCVWRGLYERAFIEKYHLRFVDGITIMEDLVFMIQALLKADGICVNHGIFYHYRQNPKSVLHSYNQKMWEDQIRVHELLEESLKEAHLEERMRKRLDMRYIGMVFGALKNETFVNSDQEIKERFVNMKEICTDNKLKMILERVKPISRLSNTKGEEITIKRVKKEKTKKTRRKLNKQAKIKLISKKEKKEKRGSSYREKLNLQYELGEVDPNKRKAINMRERIEVDKMLGFILRTSRRIKKSNSKGRVEEETV